MSKSSKELGARHPPTSQAKLAQARELEAKRLAHSVFEEHAQHPENDPALGLAARTLKHGREF